jgi:hypothetical protein
MCNKTQGESMKRWNRLPSVAVGVALLLGLAVSNASAQTSVSASADVLAVLFNGLEPLTIAKLQDLDFGAVDAQLGATAPQADGATFRMTGEPSFPVTVSFTLPAVLTNAALETIPIQFGTADGLEWTDFATLTLGTTFNPNAAYATTMDGGGVLEIGLIGTIPPAPTAADGLYTATVDITVAY